MGERIMIMSSAMGAKATLVSAVRNQLMRRPLIINYTVNVEPIKSLRIVAGWACSLYTASNCQTTRGPPQTIYFSDVDIDMFVIPFEIWSMACKRPMVASTLSLGARAEDGWAPASAAPSPLRVCHNVNMGGACYDYTQEDGCKGNPCKCLQA